MFSPKKIMYKSLTREFLISEHSFLSNKTDLDVKEMLYKEITYCITTLTRLLKYNNKKKNVAKRSFRSTVINVFFKSLINQYRNFFFCFTLMWCDSLSLLFIVMSSWIFKIFYKEHINASPIFFSCCLLRFLFEYPTRTEFQSVIILSWLVL